MQSVIHCSVSKVMFTLLQFCFCNDISEYAAHYDQQPSIGMLLVLYCL